jgi:hypothetical protein
MATTITNRAKHLLILQLNDGQSIYLAPNETSRAIDETQLNGNEQVSKLMQNNLITSNEEESEGVTAPEEKATVAGAAADGAAEKTAADSGEAPDAGTDETSASGTETGAAVDSNK